MGAGALRAAASVGTTLAELQSRAHIVIKGITDTQFERINAAVTEAVKGGVPMAETINRVNDIVNDPSRAALIAVTELARASTAARRATWQRNHVPRVAWHHQPGACDECMQNAAASPIGLGDSWPSGDVPVHPRCRCVEMPVVG